jgi:Trk K+ transport system NAD-binding subunit
VVQLDRRDGEVLTRPPGDTRLQAGDGVLLVTRAEVAAITAMFQAPADRVRAGRSLF